MALAWLGVGWLDFIALCSKTKFFVNYIWMAQNVMWSILNLWAEEPKLATLCLLPLPPPFFHVKGDKVLVSNLLRVWLELTSKSIASNTIWFRPSILNIARAAESLSCATLLDRAMQNHYFVCFKLFIEKPRECDIENSTDKLWKFEAKCVCWR